MCTLDYTQTREEEIFSNKHHSSAMDEFLEFLGDRVKLNGFKGYKILFVYVISNKFICDCSGFEGDWILAATKLEKSQFTQNSRIEK